MGLSGQMHDRVWRKTGKGFFKGARVTYISLNKMIGRVILYHLKTFQISGVGQFVKIDYLGPILQQIPH